MNKFTFIVNPVSGKRGGERAAWQLHSEIQRKGATSEIVLTHREGHATEIAYNTPIGAIIAVGGDGTVNEVVNGIIGTKKNPRYRSNGIR